MYVYTYLVNKADSDFNKLFDTLNISTVLTLQWYGYPRLCDYKVAFWIYPQTQPPQVWFVLDLKSLYWIDEFSMFWESCGRQSPVEHFESHWLFFLFGIVYFGSTKDGLAAHWEPRHKLWCLITVRMRPFKVSSNSEIRWCLYIYSALKKYFPLQNFLLFSFVFHTYLLIWCFRSWK